MKEIFESLYKQLLEKLIETIKREPTKEELQNIRSMAQVGTAIILAAKEAK